MSALIDRYWEQYAIKEKSQDREKAVLEGIRGELGDLFVREVDGAPAFNAGTKASRRRRGCPRARPFDNSMSCTT